MLNDNFKYINVTNSNMSDLFCKLKKNEEIIELCKVHSLNMQLLKNLFFFAAKGYNNTQLAQKIGVHRVTVQRYNESLRSMTKEDYMRLFYYAIGGQTDETNNTNKN